MAIKYQQTGLSLPKELFEQIEGARAGRPRSHFIVELIKDGLKNKASNGA